MPFSQLATQRANLKSSHNSSTSPIYTLDTTEKNSTNNYSELYVYRSKRFRVKEGFVTLLQSAARQLHSVRGDPASHIQLCFPPKTPIYIT